VRKQGVDGIINRCDGFDTQCIGIARRSACLIDQGRFPDANEIPAGLCG
jgi:hypothetical protein